MSAADERALRAEQYVLGLLTPSGEERLEAELARDAQLAAEVARAAEMLLPLDLEARPHPIPPAFVERLRRSLGEAESARPGEEAAPSADAPRRRSAILPAVAAGVFGLVAGALLPLGPAPPEAVALVVLTDEAGTAYAVVEAFDDEDVRVRFVTDVDVPDGRVMQMWTKYSEAVGPVSLGLLPDAAEVVLEADALPAPVPRQLYEITFEPDGGSPEAGPTGEILAKGLATVR